jgi:(1->4)-alpha-D-glucan 1-alpha-D-glucosylmutase
MYVTWKLLQFRRANPDLFLHGEYLPLRVTGRRANHVIAFARRLHDQCCIVAVPRLFASLSRAGAAPLGGKVWRDTQIEFTAEPSAEWTNVLTGERLSSPLRASDLFGTLPFAVAWHIPHAPK